MDLYVYYRVRSEDTAALHPLVLAMQERLARQHGVPVSLKRRPEEKNGEQTWMEVYLSTPAGFDQALQQAATDAGLAAHISGARHTEVFMDISTCA